MYSLKDALLQNYDADVLKMIVWDQKKERPDELAEAAAERLLQPDVMRRKMMFLHDDDISFFEYACKGKTSVAKANYVSADRIREANYGFVTDMNMTFRIPDDVVSVYEQINEPSFHEKRRKMSWLLDCAKLIPLFYGIITVGDFSRLYRRNPKRSESDEEIVLVLLPELFRYAETNLVLHGNELISSDLEKTGNMDKIRQLHREYPISFPTYAEIKNITEDFYPSGSQSYRKLKQRMIRMFSMSSEKADAMLEVVFVNIAVGCQYDDIADYLSNNGLKMTDDQRRQLKSVMQETWLDTRCLMFNGQRPSVAAPQMLYVF